MNGSLVRAVLLVALASAAGVADDVTNRHRTVKLTDGTVITVSAGSSALPIRTQFGDISVPLASLELLTFSESSRTVTVFMVNGDRVQGTFLQEHMTVSSVLGDLKVPFGAVKEVSTAYEHELIYADTTDRFLRCLRNLREIDAAKMQLAVQERLTNGAVVVEGDARLNRFMKDRGALVCPAGGKYWYGGIGKWPRCSIPGHNLDGLLREFGRD